VTLEQDRQMFTKYIEVFSDKISRAVRQGRPRQEIEELQQNHNRAVLALEQTEFRISIGQR